jgi:redox-sensitive bicupin YhaK (pirin superfamily)
MTTDTRSHTRVIPTQQTVEGGGFRIRRPFPVAGLSHLDPILLIDEMGPVVYGPGEAVGAPDHPHRGFETVTYLIDGAMEHEDSHGHRGTLRPGDVQWMTAGAGVIHSEMPAGDILAAGGRVHGFQIWLNLPKALKLTTPRYQEYKSGQLPVVVAPGRWVRVIAGELDGQRSPIETTVPSTMLHVKLDRGATTDVALPPGANAVVHLIDGGGMVGTDLLVDHQAALIENAPATVQLSAGRDGLEALVIAAMPIGEPVARYGPFVMNTRAELERAFADYQAGRFGEIARVDSPPLPRWGTAVCG